MRTEESDGQGVRSELIARLFSCADRLQQSTVQGDHELAEVLSAWWHREAHLAVERAFASIEGGVPEPTAWFLACDDAAFQLALAAADRYYVA